MYNFRALPARQNVVSDLDRICLTLWGISERMDLKVDIENNQLSTKKHDKYSSMQEVIETKCNTVSINLHSINFISF